MSDAIINQDLDQTDPDELVKALRQQTDAVLWQQVLLAVPADIRHEFRRARDAHIAAEMVGDAAARATATEHYEQLAAQARDIIRSVLQKQWARRASELQEARAERDYWRNEYEALILLT